MVSKKVFCDEKGKDVIIQDSCDGGFPNAHSFNSVRAITNIPFAIEFASFYCEYENDCYEGDNVPPKCAYRKLKGEATLYSADVAALLTKVVPQQRKKTIAVLPEEVDELKKGRSMQTNKGDEMTTSICSICDEFKQQGKHDIDPAEATRYPPSNCPECSLPGVARCSLAVSSFIYQCKNGHKWYIETAA